MLNEIVIKSTVENALLEDINGLDYLNDSIIEKNTRGKANAVFKQSGVVSGLEVFKLAFELVDRELEVDLKKRDGEIVEKGEEIAIISGKISSILKAERVALNFLQRMSGISTMAHTFKERVESKTVRITDTRKTTPGLRLLEKYAVITGGCYNHRYSLTDAIMIKDNHIKAIGSIKEAVWKTRKVVPHTMKIEVEVETLDELKEALEAKADIIMLDNMSLEEMKKAVEITDKKAVLEASGNVNLENVNDIAKTGVDIISVGALTHSVKSVDISLNII